MFGIEDNPLKRIRLTQGKRVELLLPGTLEGPVPCMIAAVKDDSVYIEIPESLIEVIMGLRGERMTLRFTTGRDVFNLGTRLFDYSIGIPFVAILRLIEGHSRQMQRRVHRRCEVRMPVTFTVTMSGLEGENELLRRHCGETIDMGLGGILFRTPFRVEPGRGVTVFVDLDVSRYDVSRNDGSRNDGSDARGTQGAGLRLGQAGIEGKAKSSARLAINGRAIRRRPYPDGGFEVAVAFTTLRESNARLLSSFLEADDFTIRQADSAAWGG